MCEDRFAGNSCFEDVERFLLLLSPLPFSVFACEFVQRSCNVGETSNKWSVKIAKSQKGADVLDFSGYGPIFNARNFGWVHACHPLFKDYPQVIDGRGMEHALLRFEVKVMILRDREDIFNGGNMIREGGGRSYGNIVHIDSNDGPLESVLCDDILVYLIHHCLECCGGVAKSKKHDSGLKESISCFERCFVFIALFDPDVVVSPSYVEL